MNLTTTQKLSQISDRIFQNLKIRTNTVYMAMIIAALIAFEIFNFSSTSFALDSILGGQSSGGLSWSTILALAFCGMDFAGIARLLGPQENQGERSSWYLLGAWVLAAAMNTGLTWWGVSVAVYNQPVEYALIINPLTFVTIIPVLVAVMVWVIRILIIGTLVTSFNQAIKEDSSGKMSQKTSAFGFKTNPGAMPAGYQPMQSPARSSITDNR